MIEFAMADLNKDGFLAEKMAPLFLSVELLKWPRETSDGQRNEDHCRTGTSRETSPSVFVALTRANPKNDGFFSDCNAVDFVSIRNRNWDIVMESVVCRYGRRAFSF